MNASKRAFSAASDDEAASGGERQGETPTTGTNHFKIFWSQSQTNMFGDTDNLNSSQLNGNDSGSVFFNSDPHERLSYADASVMEVDIALIVPNPYQPRKNFNESALRELADSIREHGVIQPLVVNKTGTGYELVVGERRFRASQLAGLSKVPVIVKAGMQDQTKLEVALIENIQRQELNPIEEALAYDKLMKMFGLTQEKVAQKVGKSRPAVANTVRLLNLPAEIQRAIIESKISEGHARAILGLTGVERQMALFKMILDQGLNVRQVESKVRELMARPRLEAAGPDPRVMAIENELRRKLGTRVRVEKRGAAGRITIEFFSEDELNQLLDRIEGENGNAMPNTGTPLDSNLPPSGSVGDYDNFTV